jgi:DNA polymerase-4/DNA polymerase IV (DinB-like DNA polymerase)
VVVPAVLDDVLFLLALCVENRAKRVGLVGEGVVLKITYADMKKITRSHLLEQPSDDAVIIYEEGKKLLSQVEDRAVRLIGVGIYNLTEDNYRQMSFEDLLGDPEAERAEKRKARFRALEERYHLDFEGHLTEIYRGETLHRTAEYMRKHI